MLKFIVFDSGSSASKLMFQDLKNHENTIETSAIYKIDNPILAFINHAHMSLKLKGYINLPFKSVWNRFNYLESIYNEIDTFVLVFTNVSIKKVYEPYLKDLQRKSNVKLVLVAVDSFVDKELSALPYIKAFKFDLVYSFDESDCRKYNLRHTVSLYSKRTDISPEEEKSDIFWIGRAKDRLESILDIAEKANEIGMKCDFYVLGVKPDRRKVVKGIFYIDRVIPYEIVLPKVLAARCLLDINQTGQKGMTMRVYEAIFYNKLLITNNWTIKTLKYYDDRYMKQISNIEDVDLNFLLEPIDVDYNYAGEYSPICFLNRVQRDLMLERLI